MSELIFPISALLLLYFVAVPAFTLVSMLILRVMRRRTRHAHEMGSSTVWWLMVAPVVLPLTWLIGASTHQWDGHHAVVACLSAHEATVVCMDIFLVVAFVIAPVVWRAIGQRDRTIASELIVTTHDGVTYSRGQGVAGLVRTRGLLSPRIEVDNRIVDTLDASQLKSVLLHERAHVRGRDPLKKWLAQLCLSTNPLGGLLRGDLARWDLGREVRCDVAAVRAGADRFALASALVKVAKSQPRLPAGCCGLIGADALHLRVRVLCDDALPRPSRDIAPSVMAAITLALALPHGAQAPLDWLHRTAESGWFALVGG